MILQLKTGHLERDYFRRKFDTDIVAEFRAGYDKLQADGMLIVGANAIETTPAGLLQIDRHLTAFFDPQYVGKRYT